MIHRRLRAACLAILLVPSASFGLAAPPPASEKGLVVRGTVTEAEGGAAVPGAEVFLVELDRVAATDVEGRFVFTAVPAGTFTVSVRLSGFALHNVPIVVPGGELLVKLKPARFAGEVTVTASPFALDRLEVAQQVDSVKGEDLSRQSTASLGQALAEIPGVTNIPTGEALGTPVIRGLSEHRIRVLNGDVPVNHQQFSWRHSPSVEASLAHTVEVVRGPASVLYGPDAMGGVINIIPRPLLGASGGSPVVHGEVAGGWGSNADEFTGRAEVEGALGAFGWNAGVVRRDSGDLETPAKTLENTDFEQTNGNVAVGLSGSWGMARVRWAHWEVDTGFYRPVGFRLGLDDDLFVADTFLPTSIGDLEISAGRQTNIRQSFPAALAGMPEVDLKLVTQSVRAGLRHRSLGPFRGRVAVEYLGLDNDPREGVKLVPEYDSQGWAAMLFEEGRFLRAGDLERLIVSFGARWDSSDLDVPMPPGAAPGVGFSRTYGHFTGSLGVVYRASGTVSFAGSLGRGWRPPNAFELFAKGTHNGVAAFQIGNPNLEEESNVAAELSARVNTERVRGYVTAYRNSFDRFIYLADTGTFQGPLPVFEHRQADATIEGLEAALEGAVTRWLRLGATYTYVDTENRETGRPMPQEPAARWLLRAIVEGSKLGPFQAPFAGVDVHLVGSQEVSGRDEPLGTPTASYTLVDLRAGFELRLQSLTLGLDLTIRNLLDEAYTDFLYSYKNVAQNPGRDVRLVTRLRF
ncbi:MAG: TonB-dependent receptor [Holophagales bacterium]|nr:TonB-dependent receptor [Holophagales bacterium]